MAWDSIEEQAMSFVRQHLEVSSGGQRIAYSKLLQSKKFSRRAWYWRDNVWGTFGEVAECTLWGNEHFLRNLKLAMIKEMLGIGPKAYCAIDTNIPDFENRLLLLLNYLPLEKICLLPPRETLGGPFLHPPWQAIGETLCKRASPDEDSLGIGSEMQALEMALEAQGHRFNDLLLTGIRL